MQEVSTRARLIAWGAQAIVCIQPHSRLQSKVDCIFYMDFEIFILITIGGIEMQKDSANTQETLCASGIELLTEVTL